MTAAPNAFDAARALSNIAGALVDDSRRIDRLADQIGDQSLRQELKASVRTLLDRASQISELAGNLASEAERAYRQKY
jgi:hypothetical protein